MLPNKYKYNYDTGYKWKKMDKSYDALSLKNERNKYPVAIIIFKNSEPKLANDEIMKSHRKKIDIGYKMIEQLNNQLNDEAKSH